MVQSEMPAQTDVDRVEISTSLVKTLLDLPPEIIFQIAAFLPTTSAASFALCNKRSAAHLGSRPWKLLSSLEPEDRIHFLSILSRDLPRHHVCHGCIRLHLSSSTPLPANIHVPPEPASCIPASTRGVYSEDGFFRISNYFSPYRLRFSHVQLALKQHHHGLDHGISLSDLSHTDIQFVHGTVYLFSVDARISSKEMVVRSQEWVISSQHPREHFLSRKLHLGVCQHLMTYNAHFGPYFDDSLTSLIRCRLDHGAADDDCACMRLHQCPSCPMEYQIDVLDFEERGTAICATKWLNLGAGLTTRDSNWRGQNLSGDEHVPHNLPLGSIRSSYESQEGASVDDLTAENKKRLSSSLCVIGRSLHLNTDGFDWKLAGDDIWYIGTLEDSNTIPRLLRRLFASASRTIAQVIEVLF
jgi:hypothetical protein